jgi:hypothetical protein
MKENLSQDFVKELFDYDPESGELTWRVSRANNQVKVGQIAGTTDWNGYRAVRINNHRYRVHQIIWLWMTGYLPSYPKDEIDHDDNVKDNNKWENLILTDHEGNMNNELTKVKISEALNRPEVKARHSEAMKIAMIGNTNSKGKLIGRIWITDSINSRRIKPDESIPSGWTLGRK